MKIGETISAMEFSSSEKDRIGSKILDTSSLHYLVLTTKLQSLNSPGFWRQAQSRFKITGFREGHPTARGMILKRAMDSLKNQGGSANLDIWPIYRNCVRLYVSDELEKLNSLLEEENVEDLGSNQTEQVFRSIHSKMPLYQATIEEMRKLYELWAFDRTVDFEKIFSENSVSPELVRRIVKSEGEAIKRDFVAGISDVRSDFEKRVSKIVEQSENFGERFDEVEARIDSSVSLLRTEFQNLAASVLQKKVQEIGDTFKKLAAKGNPQEEKKVDLNADFVLALQNRVDKISKKLQHLEESSLKNSASRSAVHKTESVQDTDAENYFSAWQKIRETREFSFLNDSLLWTLLQIIRRSRIFISERTAVLEGLLNAASGCEVKRITASPLWIMGTDWEAANKFILEENKGPRLLIIFDFDVAIQESYLVPELVSWISAPNIHSCSRIILVPSKSGLEYVCERILELSIFLDFEAEWLVTFSKLESTLSVAIEEEKKKQTKIEYVGFRNLIDKNFERDLKLMAQNAGLKIPQRLVGQFANIYSGLVAHLPSGSAGKIAAEVAILPWVRRARGEHVSRGFEATIMSILGGQA